MKPKKTANSENKLPQSAGSERLIGRREVITKAGWYALSAATMMVLLKSQPAKAQSPITTPRKNNASTDQTGTWTRTTRS